MSGLILNFDWDNTKSNETSIKHQIKQTPGSWTQKLRQKKLAKHHQKIKNKDSNEITEIKQNETQNQNQNQNQNQKHTLLQPQSHSETSPRKKPKLDSKPTSKSAAKPTQPFQIISSLFSSTIIPIIKPNPKPEQSSLVVYAPSNASLSEIKITSPSLNLHPQLSQHLNSSTKIGPINSPTCIQSIAWPLLSAQSNNSTRDVIIQSETGSGKTLAYLVPIVQDLLNLSYHHPEINWNREIGTLAIILVPTRELAEQVYQVAINLLSFTQKNRSDVENLPEAKSDLDEPGQLLENKTPIDRLNPRWLVPGTLHGGTNRTHEKARLRRGLPLLVCTPGRLLDHLEKTVSLRMAGEKQKTTSQATDKTKLDSKTFQHHSKLHLRWLVVDEADRLMDMGFEEQMSGILKHLKDRETRKDSSQRENNSSINCRRTILCSATMPDGVKKLVGMSLNDPILLKATGPPPSSEQEQNQSNDTSSNQKLVINTHQSDNNSKFSAPSQLSQFYVITPPKLRLVSLIALLRQITNPRQKKPAEKILVFMSCTASVDFHFEALGNILSSDHNEEENNDGNNKKFKTGPKKQLTTTTNELDSSNSSAIMRKSKLIPGVKIFRLHGNLDLQTRLKSLKTFSESTEVTSKKNNSNIDIDIEESTNSSVLFCTSLAGRGLDVPFVSHVIQYDLPTEGGVTEYLHRIGRTARAGQSGQAWNFVLPTEADWIGWCESSQNHHLNDAPKSTLVPKLNQIDVQKLLADGFAPLNQKDWESKATDTQMAIEKWVLLNQKNHNLASIGFMSHIRAYTTHPSAEKKFFNIKNLHLGHLAKSFGLRDPPKNLSSTTKTTIPKQAANYSNNKHENKNKRDITMFQQQQDEISDDDDDDDDFKSNNFKNKSNFLPLSQSQFKSNSFSLKGPMGNSIHEFNLG